MTVTRLAPGQGCVFFAALENIGEQSVVLTESVTIAQPAGCPLFQYSDNVPTTPPSAVAPDHDYSYSGKVALSSNAGNACEGAQATIDVTLTGTEAAETYSVSFSENGLPSGLAWSVTLGGLTRSLVTDGCADTLTWTGLAGGTYDYSIAPNPGWHQAILPYSGSVVVDGASMIEPTLIYTESTYPVTFSETGLPSGLTWKVSFAGVTKSLETNGGTDTLSWTSEPNGTYSYTIGTVAGYTASPSSGSVKVNGAAVSVDVKFTKS